MSYNIGSSSGNFGRPSAYLATPAESRDASPKRAEKHEDKGPRVAQVDIRKPIITRTLTRFKPTFDSRYNKADELRRDGDRPQTPVPTPAEDVSFAITIGDLPYLPKGHTEQIKILGPRAPILLKIMTGDREDNDVLPPIFVVSRVNGRSAPLASPTIDELNSDLRVSSEWNDKNARRMGVDYTIAVVVVEPDQYQRYRKHWKNMTYAILPQNRRGIGYARFIIHRALRDGIVSWGNPERFPLLGQYWMLDDNIALRKRPRKKGISWDDPDNKIYIVDGLKQVRIAAYQSATDNDILQDQSEAIDVIGMVRADDVRASSNRNLQRVAFSKKPGENGDVPTFVGIYKAFLIRLAHEKSPRGPPVANSDFVPGTWFAEDIGFLHTVTSKGGIIAKVSSIGIKHIDMKRKASIPPGAPPVPWRWDQLLLSWRFSYAQRTKELRQFHSWEKEELEQIICWIMDARVSALSTLDSIFREMVALVVSDPKWPNDQSAPRSHIVAMHDVAKGLQKKLLQQIKEHKVNTAELKRALKGFTPDDKESISQVLTYRAQPQESEEKPSAQQERRKTIELVWRVINPRRPLPSAQQPERDAELDRICESNTASNHRCKAVIAAGNPLRFCATHSEPPRL